MVKERKVKSSVSFSLVVQFRANTLSIPDQTYKKGIGLISHEKPKESLFGGT